MPLPKSITINIDQEGKVEMDAVGFTGKSCDNAIKVFEEAMGEITKRNHKREYFQKEQERVKHGR